ncbi:hypothetical protein BIFGAL_03882 [Bifidobacterium gallicum DSM 20093 = LMG 11596]|uniref:Uncharacterized protein n=1 Tax=Bifidobacterium gallicum DSM 20093 = LMG 11596 TaxID=561180 RepID=D1NVJ3_9BIFI|nr:hypothetical protein BIFGAL_03882 [Bifidobacterium gallicum DSM 20093 = LMG 11596]
MRFGSWNCGFADQVGKGRRGLGAETAVLLTGLVSGDAVWESELQFS